jgi:transcription initiation factor TFIID TATA-box-binding protein
MRKRFYTPLSNAPDALCQGEAQEDSAPVPVIHNIVSTAQIESTRMPMDLQAISEILPGSSYDRRKFAAMTIRLANPSCTLLLFSSGKLVVTGGKNWYEGVLSCLRIARFLQRALVGVDFWLKSCNVQNIVAHVEVPVGAGGSLDLDAMYTRLNLHCTYQKNMFPGLIYRPHASPVVLLCFLSGKIVITGGKSEQDVMEGWRRLWPTLRVFVREEEGTGKRQKINEI